jgi:hypothetical protein
MQDQTMAPALLEAPINKFYCRLRCTQSKLNHQCHNIIPSPFPPLYPSPFIEPHAVGHRQRSRAVNLKGQCHENFASCFFMNHLPPSPMKIALGSFEIFSKIRGNSVKSSQSAPPVSTTPVINLPQVSLVSLIPVALESKP